MFVLWNQSKHLAQLLQLVSHAHKGPNLHYTWHHHRDMHEKDERIDCSKCHVWPPPAKPRRRPELLVKVYSNISANNHTACRMMTTFPHIQITLACTPNVAMHAHGIRPGVKHQTRFHANLIPVIQLMTSNSSGENPNWLKRGFPT